MQRTRQPELPGCKPLPLKYKETPAINSAGTPLTRCGKCDGSGEICTAERTTFHKRTGEPTTESLPEFPGSLRAKRERGGVYSFLAHLHCLQGRRAPATGRS